MSHKMSHKRHKNTKGVHGDSQFKAQKVSKICRGVAPVLDQKIQEVRGELRRDTVPVRIDGQGSRSSTNTGRTNARAVGHLSRARTRGGWWRVRNAHGGAG